MVCKLVLLLFLFCLYGCPLIPSRTEPWCLPKAKYDRDSKAAYLGVRCAF